MKKILLDFLLIPLIISLLGVVKYNIQLHVFIDDGKFESLEDKKLAKLD